MGIATLPAFDLRGTFPWMHPAAVLATRFESDLSGPDEYWLDAAGGPLAATSLLSISRSSPIILRDKAGIYQVRGTNEFPRTDAGLLCNGQYTRLNTDQNFNPTDTTGLVSRNSAALDIVARSSWPSSVEAAFVSSPLRDLTVTSALRVTCPGSVVNEGVTFFGTLPMNTDGIASAFVFVESGATPLIGLSATAQVLSGQEVLDGFERTINPVASSAARAMAIATNHNVAAAASVFWVVLADLKAGTFATPPIAHPTTTTLASDIRTIQGVRPSNGQPEPFPGWEAAGLDAGFTILIDLENRFRNAATRRFLAFSGGSGGFRIETTTSGTQFRVYSSDTTLSGLTGFPGGQRGARSRAAVRAQGTTITTAQQGSGSVNSDTRGFIQYPQELLIGGSPEWNDLGYGLQICPPLPDAELLAWTNTA